MARLGCGERKRRVKHCMTTGGAQAQLEARAQRAYERALRMTATMGRRFVGEWQALRPRRARSRRVLSRKSS